MGGGQVTGDGEAEAGSAGAAGAGFVEAGEPVEDAGPVGGWNAGAVVLDGQDQVGSGSAYGDGDLGPCVAAGVSKEVAKQSVQVNGVAREDRVVRGLAPEA
ncbi:hypothetical protein Shyd_18270 [Streptomyces hydrogenans]|uniref:Uncharacterized protein n=1 Tax=Streptomyces hydrogenans TaxID=1873719 RepID=A0ABQ3P615_9ACTN|nr:hypothetical protein Shyd_18270 [Streptomyces hydrogenans]